MQPIADVQKLLLVWELPPLLKKYRAMVPQFVRYIMAGQFEGSLYHHLKEQNWYPFSALAPAPTPALDSPAGPAAPVPTPVSASSQ